MDPAEFTRVKEVVTHQGQRLGKHEVMLQQLLDQMKLVSEQLTALRSEPQPSVEPPQAAAPVPSVLHVSEPNIPPPAKYSGDPNTCREFLTQVQLAFDAQPTRFGREPAKIAYVANLLQGPPLTYFNALREQGSTAVQSFAALSTELKRVYDHPIRGQQAGQQLLRLRQGRRSVREFACEFRTLAVESKWNEQALLSAFQNGLSRVIGKEIALRKEQLSLDEAISTAINISDHMSQWQADAAPPRSSEPPFGVSYKPLPAEPRFPVPAVLSSSSPGEEPMQVGRASLTPEERLRRVKAGLCIYCGQSGHFLAACPLRPKEQAHQ